MVMIQEIGPLPSIVCLHNLVLKERLLHCLGSDVRLRVGTHDSQSLRVANLLFVSRRDLAHYWYMHACFLLSLWPFQRHGTFVSEARTWLGRCKGKLRAIHSCFSKSWLIIQIPAPINHMQQTTVSSHTHTHTDHGTKHQVELPTKPTRELLLL